MKPVKQSKAGGSNAPLDEMGDCVPAALASLLEIELADIPIPHREDVMDWWFDVQEAVGRYGYYIVRVHPETELRGYWIAGVPSLNCEDTKHVIVMCDAVVAHDPSFQRCYATGTSRYDFEVGDCWVLVPFDPVSLLRC